MNRQEVSVPDSGRDCAPFPWPWPGQGRTTGFIRQSSFVQLLEGLVAIALIGVANYLTGGNLDLSPVYLLPVLWISYHTDKNTALLFALSCVVVGCAINTVVTSPSLPLVLHYSNSLIKFVLLQVVVYLLCYLRGSSERVQRLANTDALTGLLNPRHFRQLAEVERQRAERYRRGLTAVYVDVDCFKQFNDTQGHQAGDQLLCTVAAVLRQGTRAHDLVARLGGDEFSVLLVEADFGSAHECLLRLRVQLNETMQQHGWPMTFSLGAVTYGQAPVTVGSMLEQADRFMYQVKRNGKDRLEHGWVGTKPGAGNRLGQPGGLGTAT